MAETIAQISRGLNNVRTVAQVKIAIGEALNALGRAYMMTGINAVGRRALDSARLPLEAFYREVSPVPDQVGGEPTPYVLGSKRLIIERAYVEIAGVGGVIAAKNTVSFVAELKTSASETLKNIGEGLGAVASGAGDAAGTLLGGLLSGLGPVFVLVLAIVIYFAAKRRGLL